MPLSRYAVNRMEEMTQELCARVDEAMRRMGAVKADAVDESKLRKLSDNALDALIERLSKIDGETLRASIAAGYGDYTKNELRAKFSNVPVVKKNLDAWDEYHAALDHREQRRRMGSKYVRGLK